MRNLFFSLIVGMIAVIPVAGQKFIVKGQLVDSTSVGLPSATIMILQSKDSSLVNFGTSNTEGSFEIKNVSAGDYFLKVSYIGYQTLTKRFTTQAGTQEVNLGKLSMANQTKVLNEVTVKGEKQAVVVKKDTIEFNATVFKTKANATVEDLIKKMPGIEVARDGTVTAQGEQVQRVMVDGKEFFGRDPKLATRNLPADAVEKVQVYDKKSDQAVFTGIDDGQREKTMNLELKEEKRHAAFGNSMAGVGSNDRWQARSSLNKFNKGNQLSFLGMGNNINEQGFSFGDYANFGGAGGGGGGGNNTGATLSGQQNGIVTNAAGGVNSNTSYNKEKTKVNASYFYNHLDQYLTTDLKRVNYLSKDSTYNFSQFSRQQTINDNHRVNLTVDQKLDSFNSIKFNSNFSYNTSGQNIFSEGKTWNVGNTALRNENSQTTNTTSNSFTLNSSLLWRHRFAKKGRTLTSNFTYAYANTGADGNLNSTNHFLIPRDSIADVSQTNKQSTISPTYGLTLTFTEPLGKRRYLEFDYNITSDINKVSRDVYDWKNEQQIFSTSLSNQYNSNYLYSRPGINFRVNRDKYTFTVGSAFQQTMLNGELKNQTINRTFQAVLPVFHFNYDFAMGKRLRVDYTTSMQEPTITQLQPIINNSDQLNLSTGNPQLQPSYVNQLRMNFNSFNPESFMSFFALVNGNYTTNAIVNSQTTSQLGVRLTKPVNVSSGASLNGNFSVGIPITSIKSRVNIGPNYSISRSINLVNNQENRMVQQTIGGLVRYNFTLDEILIVDLSANLSSQETSYSSQQNQSFFNQTYSSEVNVNFLKNYAFNTEFNYFDYQSASTNFHQAIPLWNISCSRYMLKNKSGELKLGVVNVLDYSLSVTQTASTNYLQQQTTNNLGRYVMLSFTYILNKQLNPMGAVRQRGGGGGNRMMFRQ